MNAPNWLPLTFRTGSLVHTRLAQTMSLGQGLGLPPRLGQCLLRLNPNAGRLTSPKINIFDLANDPIEDRL